MRRRLLLAFLLLATVASGTTAAAQGADPGLRRVVLTDGTVVVGTVVDEAADPLVVVAENGVEQRIPRDRVAEITPLFDGRFSRLDPNRSRLFIVPTGRTLGRGNGRLSTFIYILPNVAYGVTDRIDASGSAFLLFGSADAGAILSGNLKVQPLRTDGVAAAVGATATVPVGTGEGGLGGFLYGVGTFGSETRAFTGGVIGIYGSGFDEDDGGLGVADGVLVLAGYEHQLTSGLKLITENYLAVGEGSTSGIITAGVRLFGDRFAVDLYGFVAAAEGEFGGFAPIANFSYNFGR